jgi:hypothetical protein
MRGERKYVICFVKKGYEASLELRKIYQVIADKAAAKPDQRRVID